MDGLFSAINVIVRLGNLVLAGYLLSILAPLCRAEKHASFSRTVQLMLVAISMFLAVEIIQVFGLLPEDVFAPAQALISFIFLLMLIAAMLMVKGNLLAHDHMMHRKLREKMRDVE